MSPRFSTTRPGLGQTWTGLGSFWHVLLPCKCRKCECTRSRCLRLFNSHTCSISQCNHKFWLNYRIKMFVLNLKMCVRVQPALSCCSQLLATSKGQANTSPTGLPSLQPLAVNQGRPSTSPSPSLSLTTIAVPNLKTGTHSRLHVQLSARRI